MALKLHLGGCFPAGGPSKEDFLSAAPRAAVVRDKHLADVPFWQSLGGRTDLLELCQNRFNQIRQAERLCLLAPGGSGAAGFFQY